MHETDPAEKNTSPVSFPPFTFAPPTASGRKVIKAVAVAPDDKVVVAKSLSIARLTGTTGALDSILNTTIQPDWDVYAVHVSPDERIWTAGGITFVNGGPTMGVARIHGDVSSSAAWRSRYFSEAQVEAAPASTAPEGAAGPDDTPNFCAMHSASHPRRKPTTFLR